MADIAAGKGRGPKPFMLAGEGTARSGRSMGQQCRRAAGEERAKAKPSAPAKPATRSKPAQDRRNAGLYRSPALPLVERPPAGAGWVHEIKFDGYRIQLRIAGGNVTLKTRKGLDWTEQVRRDRRAAAALPDAIIDGEIVALDDIGAPDFAALQAALSEGKTDDLIFFAFDLLFDGGEDLRTLPSSERKDRLRARCSRARAIKRP